MLYEMAKFLRYDFDKVTLKRNCYSPEAHGNAERRQEHIQENLLEILSGAKELPVNVRCIPASNQNLNN